MVKRIKLYQVFIFLLCCFCIIACNRSKVEIQEGTQKCSSTPNNDSIAKLCLRIDSLQDSYTNLQREVEDLSSKCGKIESSHLKSLMGLVVVLLLILAIIVVVLRKEKRKLETLYQYEEDTVKKEIEAIKERLSKISINNKDSQTLLQINQRINDHESKISQLERTLDEIKTKIDNMQQKPPESEIMEKVYLGAVVNVDPPYFSSHTHCKTGEARFSASIMDKVALFEPLEIDDVKAFDYMDCAIQLSGVSRNSATKMEVRQKGKAEYRGDNWVIVEKALVVLF